MLNCSQLKGGCCVPRCHFYYVLFAVFLFLAEEQEEVVVVENLEAVIAGAAAVTCAVSLAPSEIKIVMRWHNITIK